MVTSSRNGADLSDPSEAFPAKHIPQPQVRDLPAPPARQWRYIGPGVVAAGVGMASGEFILFPYISSQVGLTFVWAALLGLMTQYFLNMEIERYTLATGETAVTGFSRLWRHWGLVFAAMAYFANIWPAWTTSSATLVTYVFGGDVAVVSVAILVLVGLILTLAPTVYSALERVQMVKVAALLLLIVITSVFVFGASTWSGVPTIVTQPRFPAAELGFALLLGALAFAGAGGGQNLVQSNWIRDKGFGMGHHVPKIVSPLTREPEARGQAGFIFPPTEQNLTHWRAWWRFANKEQLLTFVGISFVSIVFMSLLAYTTVFGTPGLSDDVSFLRVEGERLMAAAGGWFGYFFWIVGAVSMFSAALGIVDYTSRLAADVLKTSYFPNASESKVYAGLVWGLVLIGTVIVSVGFDQPLVLATIAACTGGVMMFVYSGLLIAINRRMLPKPIRISGYRLAALVWSILLFGVLAVLTVQQQIGELFG
ncbi:Nramp family divalent metal transporter [Saccharopolyspora erythraea]|uniref:Nramp family divalent metal transporter n=1 Tax=Saccharopolyspora erythraea TaxID=1836 RepID=UPI001BA8EE00|nr:Nramp family divalent metal transporter [Saccharopolyspora erythraea]QUH02354.1 Nramp family divalent metal transporter [Saccharopolyspora erythraea]